MDAMEFFERCAGTWRSQRTTHHLPFRRAENGESQIEIAALAADDAKVVEICQMHQVDPSLAAGGALVSWQATMDWDQSEEENHTGSTVMVLVPDPGTITEGILLREKGYAEIAPVAGRYLIDDEDGLVLITEYETMSAEERFSFVSDDLRVRTSTVKRFGGLSTASFCVETRIGANIAANLDQSNLAEAKPEQAADVLESKPFYSVLGW